MATGDWCLIESDPGVFTELIKGFGVQGGQVEELWSLNDSSFESLKPVHGLVFLYKWRPGEEPQGSLVRDDRIREIFFAKQEIKNACATQALLSILLNINHSDIELGTTLTEFKEFASSFSPAQRGLTITNSESIRKVHNSFAKQQLFEFDETRAKKDDDVFHFVAYLPINGRLYELDGLQEGPLDHGTCDGSDWLKSVRPVLEKRMNSYTTNEIHFNLLALVSDQKVLFEKEIAELEARKELAAQKIQALLGEGGEAMEDSSGLPDDLDTLQIVIEEADARILSLQGSILQEEAKRERYKLENIRRRHNYLPMIMEIIKLLAKRGKLVPLCEEAKRKKTERLQSEKESAKA